MLQARLGETTESSSSAEDEVVAILIPADGVERAWAVAWPLLERAVALTKKVELEEIYTQLEDGWMQLWLAYCPAEKTVLGAATTEIIAHRNTWRVASVIMLGGSELYRWEHLMAKIEEWAQVTERCDAIEVHGRKGWARRPMMKDYKESYRVFAKEF